MLIWTEFRVLCGFEEGFIQRVLSFKKVSPLAALNIPYLLWVLFASYLNIAAAVINK